MMGIALSVPLAAAAPVSDCRSFSPVAKVSGVRFYKDKAGSQSDPLLVAKNQQMLSNVRDFMACLERTVDGNATPDQLAHAYQALSHWAEAGAILSPPTDTEGRVERVFMSTGFAAIMLKFMARGIPVSPPVSRWLSQMAAAVCSDYANFEGNVYPWAGATNALVALINGDDAAKAFQQEAWVKEIGRIRPDGTVQAELARGARALIYHQLAASGLMILHKARLALGIPDNPAETAHLKLLYDEVGKSLCNPAPLASAAGAQQEFPGEWGFRVARAFHDSLLSQDWLGCGPLVIGFTTVDYGGDARVIAEAIGEAGRHHP